MSYGICPACRAVNHSDTMRERRLDGNTMCGSCKATTPSWQWGGARSPLRDGVLAALHGVTLVGRAGQAATDEDIVIAVGFLAAEVKELRGRGNDVAVAVDGVLTVSDRIQGVDCPECESGVTHRHGSPVP